MGTGNIQQRTTINDNSSTDRIIPSQSRHDSTTTENIELAVVEPVLSSNIVYVEDVPPDGGYGWVVTACVFLINAHTWGVNAAWAIFLSHYLENSTFPGATQFEYALIGGLSISQCLLSSPLVAISSRKLGTKITLGIGTVLVFTSLFGASYATKIWHLFLSQGICFGWGMGFLYITASSILPQWFSTRRSLAVGIASSGAGLGGLAYNLAAGAGAQTLGLRWTYRVLAFCALGVNGVCAILIRDRNKAVRPNRRSFDYKELIRIEVILLIIWGFLTELGYIVLLYSLPHFATTIGLSQSQGSVVGAMLNVGLAVGRPCVGYFSDRFGRINMATMMTLSTGICCLALWVPAKTFGLLLIFALCAGLGVGTFWGTVTAVATEVVGLQRLPTAFGVICLSLVLPTTFAEPIGLEIVAADGNRAAQIFVGFMFILAASSTWLLRSWKIDQIEKKAVREGARTVEPSKFLHVSLGWLAPGKLFKTCRV